MIERDDRNEADERSMRDASGANEASETWLDELRAAWRDLPVPPPAREPDDEDALTRRTVEWTRSAWQALPVPAAGVPTPRVIVIASVRRRRITAAAAALLIAVSVPLLVIALRRSGAASSGAGSGPSVTEAGANSGTGAGGAIDPPSATSPTILAADSRCFELSSGPVRLYLFPDPPHEAPR